MVKLDSSSENILEPSSLGDRFMWVAAGYYDESEDGGSERGYAVAGFMGHQHDCVHLDLAWRERILDKYELDYFKTSELENGVQQFAKFRDDPSNLDADFSRREKDLFRRIKTEVIDLILEFNLLVGVGAALMIPDYRRISSEYASINKVVPSPYFLCAQLVMMESGFIMQRLNLGAEGYRRGLLRPVFDSHEDYSGRAKQVFDIFCKKNPTSSEFLLPPFYEDDRRYVMLQAADVLAYESRRLLITQEFDTHIPERKAMKRLKERVYKIYKLNYEAIKALMESQRPESIPFEAEIHNRHELIRELDSIFEENDKKRRGGGVPG